MRELVYQVAGSVIYFAFLATIAIFALMVDYYVLCGIGILR